MYNYNYIHLYQNTEDLLFQCWVYWDLYKVVLLCTLVMEDEGHVMLVWPLEDLLHTGHLPQEISDDHQDAVPVSFSSWFPEKGERGRGEGGEVRGREGGGGGEERGGGGGGGGRGEGGRGGVWGERGERRGEGGEGWWWWGGGGGGERGGKGSGG